MNYGTVIDYPELETGEFNGTELQIITDLYQISFDLIIKGEYSDLHDVFQVKYIDITIDEFLDLEDDNCPPYNKTELKEFIKDTLRL